MNPFPVDDVRAEFPALSITDAGVPRVYVDNPADTQVSRRVEDAAARCLLETNANLGGCFTTSVAAEEGVVDAHRAMGALSRGIVGTGSRHRSEHDGTTFHLSRGIGRTLKPGVRRMCVLHRFAQLLVF